mgnify:CR=1 FL=1
MIYFTDELPFKCPDNIVRARKTNHNRNKITRNRAGALLAFLVLVMPSNRKARSAIQFHFS